MSILANRPQDFHTNLEIAGLMCESDSRFLLVKRSLHRTQGGTWAIPASKIQQGEDPLSAIQRETTENVGIRIDHEAASIVQLYLRVPDADIIFHIFRKKFHYFPTFAINKERYIDAQWSTFSDALQLPLIYGGVEILRLYKQAIDKIDY